jgi:hypothetical protein
MSVYERAREWIENLAVGTEFHLSELYSYVSRECPEECDRADLTKHGHPKWKKVCRGAIDNARLQNKVEHLGKPYSGRWKRI